MNILIIEDEKELADSIKVFLKESDFRCDVVYTFKQALEKISIYQYDCIVADIMLPDGNGLELVRILKKNHSHSGVIIVSAKNALDDKIEGLDIGADDYLTKPFHLPELSARINSIIRRRMFEGEQEILFNEIRLIPEKRQVFVQDQLLEMTPKEYDLLLFFLSNRNRTLTREAIAEHLLGEQADMLDSFDFIYTHVKNLRKKIIEAGGGDYLHTVYAIGYRFGGK